MTMSSNRSRIKKRLVRWFLPVVAILFGSYVYFFTPSLKGESGVTPDQFKSITCYIMIKSRDLSPGSEERLGQNPQVVIDASEEMNLFRRAHFVGGNSLSKTMYLPAVATLKDGTPSRLIVGSRSFKILGQEGYYKPRGIDREALGILIDSVMRRLGIQAYEKKTREDQERYHNN